MNLKTALIDRLNGMASSTFAHDGSRMNVIDLDTYSVPDIADIVLSVAAKIGSDEEIVEIAFSRLATGGLLDPYTWSADMGDAMTARIKGILAEAISQARLRDAASPQREAERRSLEWVKAFVNHETQNFSEPKKIIELSQSASGEKGE